MDSVEDYGRRWAEEEEVEVDMISEWIKSIFLSSARQCQPGVNWSISVSPHVCFILF